MLLLSSIEEQHRKRACTTTGGRHYHRGIVICTLRVVVVWMMKFHNYAQREHAVRLHIRIDAAALTIRLTTSTARHLR